MKFIVLHLFTSSYPTEQSMISHIPSFASTKSKQTWVQMSVHVLVWQMISLLLLLLLLLLVGWLSDQIEYQMAKRLLHPM